MEHSGTPKPDPVIIQTGTPSLAQTQLPTTSKPVGNSLQKFVNKNKRLLLVIFVFLVVLITSIVLVALNSRQSTQTNGGTNPTSAPVTSIVSRPTATVTTPPTPTPITSKTLNIQVDNAFGATQKPYDSLKGTIIVDGDVTFSNPTPYEGVFKKGSSSFKIWNFYEESDHKLIDSEFIGTTKTLGNTYRLAQAGNFEGAMEYFYVQPDVFKSTGTCNPTSYPNPIEAPCGKTNYKGYYFQCTGDLNFNFCDKIITDLDFSITLN